MCWRTTLISYGQMDQQILGLGRFGHLVAIISATQVTPVRPSFIRILI